jgi:patatin-like phospholipase/acyl hydrolase
VRVLAIDGGGIRGLIPALVLAEIERRTSRRVADLVDLVAGTSTGAILACALTRPNPLPAARVADLYVQEGPTIFDRSVLKVVTSGDGYLDEKYNDVGLVAALRKYLGGTRLAEATVPVLLTAYDLQARAAVLMRSSDAGSLSMVDAAHASSAAPTYFEPVRQGRRTLVDGGVFAVNPAMVAFAETAGETMEVLASLGTGEHTRALPYDEVVDWGKLEWAQPIIDVVFDASADAVDEQLSRLAGDRYIRLQTRLDEASDNLDDASEENLAALRREAQRLIDARSADIDRLCGLLAGGRPAQAPT